MKYRVVFRQRTGRDGDPSDNPPEFLDAQLDDSTVLDAALVGRNDPEGLHSEENLEEDDSFLSVGTEVWEYDVAEGRQDDFIDALRNSGMVIEFEPLESGEELGVS